FQRRLERVLDLQGSRQSPIDRAAVTIPATSVFYTLSHYEPPVVNPLTLQSASPSQVTLNPGTRLGPYEITAPLGVGGMGEVYRATDTNLKRQVAIKVLPASLASDPERLARFQREAEVLAALNHTNIAHIHGLERSDGTIALVMELVEGPTLADHIAKGAIP